jgi:hypothetical protein
MMRKAILLLALAAVALGAGGCFSAEPQQMPPIPTMKQGGFKLGQTNKPMSSGNATQMTQ